MAQRVSVVPHSHNGRWVSRSDQVESLHDLKENADAYYRLKAQGKAIEDQLLLEALAKLAQEQTKAAQDLADQIQSQQGGGGGDGGASGGGGSGAGGGGGDGGTGDGGGSDGGSGDGGSGDGGSGGDAGGGDF